MLMSGLNQLMNIFDLIMRLVNIKVVLISGFIVYKYFLV